MGYTSVAPHKRDKHLYVLEEPAGEEVAGWGLCPLQPARVQARISTLWKGS